MIDQTKRRGRGDVICLEEATAQRVPGTAGVGVRRGEEQDQLARRQRRGEALIFRDGKPTSDRW